MANAEDNRSGGKTPSRIERLVEQWDVVVFLIAFGYLAYISMDVPETGRFFPIVFLSIGLFALGVELLIEVGLPYQVSHTIKQYLEGVTGEVQASFEETAGEMITQDEREQELDTLPGITYDPIKRKAILVLLVIGYGIASYLVGIFYAIPLFVFGTIYLVGSQKLIRSIIVTVLLMIAVYFLFNQYMHVPIFDGVLLP